MFKVEEIIIQLLIKNKEKAEKVLNPLMLFTCLTGIGLLVYRYGFLLEDDEIEVIFWRMDLLFAIFAINFFVRILFEAKKIQYLRAVWFEALTNVFLVINGILNYTFNYKPILLLFETLEYSHPNLSYQHFVSLYMLLMIGQEVTKIAGRISQLNFKPATTFIWSFIILISLGTAGLMLPASTTDGQGTPFLTALFTATSASCVTGLGLEETGRYFTFKGQFIIAFLCQIGGIGIVSFATFFATFLAKGVGLKHQTMIQDHLSSEDLRATKGLMRKIIFITLSCEIIGTIAIYYSWDSSLVFNNFSQKLWYSIFHSISAFNNAGFCLFKDSYYTNELSDGVIFHATNMDINIRSMYGLHLVTAIIIIFGGIGYSTIEDLLSPKYIKERIKHPWKELKISSKIALQASVFLLTLGTIAFMILEFDKLRDRTIDEALITAFFQSVVTRTAGFNSMDFATLNPSTLILTMLLMFVGAAPGSTGGGIKCSTFYIIMLASISNIKGNERLVIENRTIPNDLILKAFSVFMFAATYNVLAIMFLSISESGNPNITIFQLAFEQVSAFSTTGLSMGITSSLSTVGKYIIILSMFIGRVGTLTLALALSSRVKTTAYRYPEGHVMVG
ncbi:MAG: Trk-type K+ transporter membrane component [Flammeovirgaceae bacterium]|nr:Trk-type K+ transporter membrane component [Flammeovirgaceae bacterium]MDW8286816.1 potassium transporter TrkG [Flammeovirgaceae bacterium]